MKMQTKLLSLKEMAAKKGCSPVTLRKLCQAGRVTGACKPTRDWLIPEDAKFLAASRIRPSQAKLEYVDGAGVFVK